MKTKLPLLFTTILLLCAKSYGQYSFGVSPGIGFNSAYVGYTLNNGAIVTFGFQYLNANFTDEVSGKRYNWDINKVESYNDKDQFSGSLYIPNIGLKYYVKQQNKLQAYILLNLSKPILSAKLENNGKESTSFKKSIDGISMFGGELGFGTEYFFDENFSIGGEFGLRYLHLNDTGTRTSSIYNPTYGDYQNTEIKSTFNFNLSPTYSRISLNYYF